MTNKIDGSLIRIDTFGNDITIGTGIVHVKSIIANGATSAKFVVFKDKNGDRVWRAKCAADGSISWEPSGGFSFPDGLIFDDTSSGLAAGDDLFIYLGAVI